MKRSRLDKQFEKDVRESLMGLLAKQLVYPVRLYDTTAARGNFLAEQPGDFIVASATGGHLLETKTSEEFASLRSCLSSHVKAHQAAAHRLWAGTGQPCWFLFYSAPEFSLELWKGDVVGEHRAAGTRLPKEGEDGGPLVVGRNSLDDLLFNCLTK